MSVSDPREAAVVALEAEQRRLYTDRDYVPNTWNPRREVEVVIDAYEKAKAAEGREAADAATDPTWRATLEMQRAKDALCDFCDGSGQRGWLTFPGLDRKSEPVTCPVCKGTGRKP